MRATTLKKRYPKQWASIENGILSDLRLLDVVRDKPKMLKQIAHNAAFLGVYELNKTLAGKAK